MSSFALAYRNYLTEPGLVANYVAGVQQGGNLLDPRRSVVAWAPEFGLGGSFELPEPKPVQIVAVLNHNGVVADESWRVAITLYNGLTEVWSSSSSTSNLWTPPAPVFMRDWMIILPEPVTADSLALDIPQSIDGPSTLVYAGHLWAGPLWIPSDGVQSDWRHSVIDPGEMVISRGGQGYARLRQRRREVEVTLTDMDFENAFGNAEGTVLDLQQLGYYVGNTEPVIVLPRIRDQTGEPPWPIDPQMIHRLGVYGRLRDPLSIRHLGGDRYSSTLQVEELM